MRTGISIKITRPDRHRLEAIIRDRNASQKHVWRVNIVLLSADGVGTNEITTRRHVETSRVPVPPPAAFLHDQDPERTAARQQGTDGGARREFVDQRSGTTHYATIRNMRKYPAIIPSL
jgi:hypothetical protein